MDVNQGDTMWMPTELGAEIAKRDLVLRLGRRKRMVRLRIGCPVKARNGRKNDPWFCPIVIERLGPREKVYSIAGEDSLQALVLALDFARRMLPHYAQKAGGTIEWVSKDLDVISPQRELVEHYGQALTETLNGVRNAEAGLRGTKDPRLRMVHNHLATLLQKYIEQKPAGQSGKRVRG